MSLGAGTVQSRAAPHATYDVAKKPLQPPLLLPLLTLQMIWVGCLCRQISGAFWPLMAHLSYWLLENSGWRGTSGIND